MSSQEELYRILKEKFSETEKTPPDRVWNNISTRLDKKRNTPPYLLLLSLALFAFFIIGGFYLLLNKNSSPDVSTSDNSEEAMNLTEKTEEDNSRSSSIYSIDAERESQSDLHNPQDEKGKKIDIEGNNAPFGKKHKGESEKHPSQRETSESSYNTSSEAAEKQGDQKTSPINAEQSSAPYPRLKNPSREGKSEKKQLETSFMDKKGSQIPELRASQDSRGLTPAVKDDMAIAHQSPQTKNPKEIAPIKSVQTFDQNAITQLPSYSDLDILLPTSASSFQVNKVESLPLPDLHLHKHHLRTFAEARIGVGYGYRDLATKNAVYSQLLQNKKSLESAKHNESYALHVGVLWDRGLAISTGIELFRQWEKYRYVDNFALLDVPLIVKDTIIQDGVEIIKSDTIADYTIGKHTYQHYNKITSIDIPLILSYEKPIHNWTISFNGGIFFNIVQTVEGKVASMNKVPVTLGNRDNLPYSYATNLGMGFYGGLGLSYAVAPGWEVGISPRIRYNPTSMMTDNSALSQSYTQFHISIGMRKYF